MTSFFAYWRKTIEEKGIAILRISVGILFVWFGFLKFFIDASPAEEIASRTISMLTLDLIPPQVSMPFLAVIECMIGIGILTNRYMQFVIPVLYFQMAGTILPLFIFPDETWEIFLVVPTLLGQYIIKNSVLISAGIILGAIAKGGKLITDPKVARKAEEQAKE